MGGTCLKDGQGHIGQAESPVEQKAEETGKLSGAGFTFLFLISLKIYFMNMGVLPCMIVQASAGHWISWGWSYRRL